MKWIPIESPEHPDFSNHILILPSCGSEHSDQLSIDVICATYGKIVGRILSDNLDFIASPDPFDPESNRLASSIDAYQCQLPKLGECLVLRVAANLPDSKRGILEYSKEIIKFSELAKIKEILVLRTISAVFCTDPQIRDWPKTIRSYGPLTEKLGVKPLEKYDQTQEMIEATVFGELCECIRRFTKIPFSAVFVFIHEGNIMNNIFDMAKAITGSEELKAPPSWEKLFASNE